MTPAIPNDTTTPGPASGTAELRTMKMPVPIVAPTPNIVRAKTPNVRFSSPPSVVAPVSAVNDEMGFFRNRAVRRDRLSDMPRPPILRRTGYSLWQ